MCVCLLCAICLLICPGKVYNYFEKGKPKPEMEISKGMAASIFININITYFDNTFLAGDVVNFWVDIVMFTP